ncbi:DUF3987 domain-containing protein [Pseudomonas sp. NPDC007930]|uniref:YfjI family protein n=1 Tax=Pseudomonas sp. NPDC007930 TaxID=3364417 RepID=UPI0036F14067
MYTSLYYPQLPFPGCHFPALSQAHPLFNNAISEIHQNLGLPLPLISLTALSAISAALQGVLSVKMPSGGSLPVSLNALITVPSGGGKNRIAKLFKKPFEEFEESQFRSYTEAQRAFESELEVWRLEKKSLLKQIQKSPGNEALKVLLRKHDQARPEAPTVCRMIFEDTTPEALMACMAEGGKNAWLVTSEGGIILSQHAMRNMPAFNQIWSGDRVTVDRKTGDSFSLRGVKLSILIMSQPGVFESFITKYGALAKESGFFARCLALAIPQNMLGQLVDDRVLEWVSLEAFNLKISELLRMNLYGVDCTELGMSAEARPFWVSIKNAVIWEQRQGGRFDDFHDLAARTPENIARVAALLHFFERRSGCISLETLDFACRLCFWHVDQFRQMFSEQSSGEGDVRALYNWFRTRYEVSPMSAYGKNYVRQRCPGALRKGGRFDAAFDILVSRGNLVLQTYGSNSVGVVFRP